MRVALIAILVSPLTGCVNGSIDAPARTVDDTGEGHSDVGGDRCTAGDEQVPGDVAGGHSSGNATCSHNGDAPQRPEAELLGFQDSTQPKAPAADMLYPGGPST